MTFPFDLRPSYIHDMRQDPPSRVTTKDVRQRIETETGGILPKGALPDDLLIRFDFKRVKAEPKPEITDKQVAVVAETLTPEGLLVWFVSDRPPPTEDMVKAEAGRRIVEFCPEWKQRNLIAQATMLIKKGEDNWTSEESAAWSAGEGVWAYIAGIRAKSDVLESTSPIPIDYTDDKYWV